MFKECKLGELCEITSSKRIFASEYVESGIPFYRSREVIERESNSDISDPLFISEKRYNEIKSKFGAPKEGELLLTSVGTLGIPYVVKKADKFYFKDGNLTWMKDFSDELDVYYLYYWFKSDFGRNSLIARSIGSSQGAITIDILKRFRIICPPVSIQKRIVHVLSKYDELIEVNNQRIKKLEQTAEELYKEWFVRFRFPNWQNTEFENGIPKGWDTYRIGKVCRITAGGDKPDSFSEDKTDAFQTPIFSNGITEKGLYGYTDKPRILTESVTVSARGTVGYTCLRRTPYVPIVRLLAIEPIKEITAIYLYHFLKLDNIEGNGTSQQQMTVPMMQKKKIIVPKMDLLERFTLNANTLYDEIDSLEKQNENLIKQRDLLLPRLMSGKLEV